MKLAAVIGGLIALGTAPAAALADTSASSNWSGYVAHHSGLNFRRVSGSWIQPRATCTSGAETFSAFWVGLGGYSTSASALEQIGTELDCTASGSVKSSAWYELVPSPAKSIAMTIATGDRMTASVTTVGHQVTLTLTDQTRRRSFTKQLTASSVDVSSADWIAEAPSKCTSSGLCQPLPLTDFGSVTFSAAQAQSAAGKTGTIKSRRWDNTKIVLQPGGRTFIGVSSTGSATPSVLRAGGTAFDVRYAQSSATSLRSSARGKAAGDQPTIVQPGGIRR